MVKAIRIVTAVVLLQGLYATAAYSAQWCTGTIRGFYIDSGGGLLISTSYYGAWTQICNTTTTWKGIVPDLCKAWLAVVNTLQVTQQQAIVFYNEDTACNALPTYGATPSPGYVMVYPVP